MPTIEFSIPVTVRSHRSSVMADAMAVPLPRSTKHPTANDILAEPSPFQMLSTELLPLNTTIIKVKRARDVCTGVSRHPRGTQLHFQFQHTGSHDSLGNILSEYYMAALYAFQNNNIFTLQCERNGVPKEFLAGTMWRLNAVEAQSLPNLCQLCTSTYPHTCRQGLNYGVEMIQQTLRQIPAPPDMDDVAIHFRCGDVLQFRHLMEYGYPHYQAYTEVLSNRSASLAFSSIGILTTSFDPGKARSKDVDFLGVCKILVEDLQEYLSTEFPHASVTIRNTQNETVKDSIGRMVHAKTVWCSPSTFCVHPAVATTGTAFIVKSSRLYPFVEEIAQPNLHIVDTTFLNMQQIVENQMTAKDMIVWLRNGVNASSSPSSPSSSDVERFTV